MLGWCTRGVGRDVSFLKLKMIVPNEVTRPPLSRRAAHALCISYHTLCIWAYLGRVDGTRYTAGTFLTNGLRNKWARTPHTTQSDHSEKEINRNYIAPDKQQREAKEQDRFTHAAL